MVATLPMSRWAWASAWTAASCIPAARLESFLRSPVHAALRTITGVVAVSPVCAVGVASDVLGGRFRADVDAGAGPVAAMEHVQCRCMQTSVLVGGETGWQAGSSLFAHC